MSMDFAEIVVMIGGALTIAFLLWFFFGPGSAAATRTRAAKSRAVAKHQE